MDTADVTDRVARWVEAEEAAWLPPLDTRALRQGIQALSSLYVQQRGQGRLSQRSASGDAKKAAFACYFAPLHYLTAVAALAELPPLAPHGPPQVRDLGSGTAAVGAAVAASTGGSVDAIDRNGWVVPSAQRTFSSLGVEGRARRASLPGALGWPSAPDLLVFGWSLNELPEGARDACARRVQAGLRKGCGLLILEPISRRVTPWWPRWRAALAPLGVQELEIKRRTQLPMRLRDLDRASGLDHSELKCRALWRPVEAPGAAPSDA